MSSNIGVDKKLGKMIKKEIYPVFRRVILYSHIQSNLPWTKGIQTSISLAFFSILMTMPVEAFLETQNNKSDNPNRSVSADDYETFLQTVTVSKDVVKPAMLSSSSKIHEVTSDLLPRLLQEKGFSVPPTFKALIMEIVSDGAEGFEYYRMDYFNTSKDRDNWWPASTVKLYAAIAALQQLGAMGFNPRKTIVTYQYEDGPFSQSFEEILNRAITDSKNPEFDRLVDIVGSYRLNRYFLTPKNGFTDTVMLRCYSGRTKNPITGKCTNRISPAVNIFDGKKEKSLPIRKNEESFFCENEGNCTSLIELAETMRRVMMHETLPAAERYKLSPQSLLMLRSALRGKYAKGGVAEGIRAAFKSRPIEIYHKAGYADGWFSDNVFFKTNDTNERWIITMANRPGRQSLDDVSIIIAELIANGTISSARKKALENK